MEEHGPGAAGQEAVSGYVASSAAAFVGESGFEDASASWAAAGAEAEFGVGLVEI